MEAMLARWVLSSLLHLPTGLVAIRGRGRQSSVAGGLAGRMQQLIQAQKVQQDRLAEPEDSNAGIAATSTTAASSSAPSGSGQGPLDVMVLFRQYEGHLTKMVVVGANGVRRFMFVSPTTKSSVVLEPHCKVRVHPPYREVLLPGGTGTVLLPHLLTQPERPELHDRSPAAERTRTQH